jgi:hypothetical protein
MQDHTKRIQCADQKDLCKAACKNDLVIKTGKVNDTVFKEAMKKESKNG